MNMELFALRLTAYVLVLGYSVVLGSAINSGNPWRITIIAVAGTVAFLVAVFLLWVSHLGGDK